MHFIQKLVKIFPLEMLVANQVYFTIALQQIGVPPLGPNYPRLSQIFIGPHRPRVPYFTAVYRVARKTFRVIYEKGKNRFPLGALV